MTDRQVEQRERSHAASDVPLTARTILVVSDLHLSAGIDPRTRRYDPRENFVAGRAFRRFIDYHLPSQPGDALLILNGDIFDFLRVIRVPRSVKDFSEWSAALKAVDREYPPDRLTLTVSRWERWFGLRTNDFKTIWKLDRIARGHQSFFAALARWLRAGGSIAFIKGNHDVELYWPLVQLGIRRHIARHDEKAPGEDRIEFHQDWLGVHNVYIEHGHQFEPVTRVSGTATLPGDREIRLPLGSLINRYIINKLEGIDPFLDNIKPVQSLLWTLVRRHPIKAIEILWRGVPLLRRAFKPYFFRATLGFAVFVASIVIPFVTVVSVALYFVLPPFRDVVTGVFRGPWSRAAVSIAGVVTPWIFGAARDLWPKKKPPHGENEYGHGIYERLLKFECPQCTRKYGIVGHTHAMDVQYLGDMDSTEAFYLNSGSWAPRWPEDRPDLAGQVEYSFLEFTRNTNGEYRHRSLEWRDDRNEPAEAKILNLRGRAP